MQRNDDSDQTKAKPASKINPFSILADNAARGLFWGYPSEYNPVAQPADDRQEERSYFDGFKAAVHTLLLPVTMTAGLGAKTVIDCASRKPLSDEDMATMKTNIMEMNDDEFDDFVKSISTYTPKSGTSRQLLDTLHQEDAFMKELKWKIEDELRKGMIEETMSKMDPEMAKFIKLEITDNYQFNAEQQAQIEQRLQEERQNFRGSHRAAQRQAVLNYLDDGANSGKKMEHVIKGGVDNISQRMRP